MQQLNEFKAMPDWKDFLKPLRVPDEMTVTGMVRAFAEDPSEDFFEKQRGARLTAFATTMHHSKFQAVKKAFADERKRTRGLWEDIVDVQNGLRNYQTNVNARLDNLQRELDALKLEPERYSWVPVGIAPSPAADSSAAVETQAATQPPAAANAAPVDTQAAPPPQAAAQPQAAAPPQTAAQPRAADQPPTASPLDEIDEEMDMELEGYQPYDPTDFYPAQPEPDSTQAKGPISKARVQQAFATLDALRAQELGFTEPPAKRARADSTDTTGDHHPVDTFASYASKCSGRIRAFSGLNNRSYIDWEDHFLSIMTAFEVPVQYWAKLAVTFLEEIAMRTWKTHVSGRQISGSPAWPEFTQTMHLCFGNPMLYLELQDKLDKLVCTQGNVNAFTAYTRKYQQLQMSLGSNDGRTPAQHVQHYIKNLPENLKSLFVSHQVTNPEHYSDVTVGQCLDKFLILGQQWLTAHASAKPTGNVRSAPADHDKRVVRAGQKRARDDGGSAMAAAPAVARPAFRQRVPPVQRVYKGHVNLTEDSTPADCRYIAYIDPEDRRPFSPNLKRILMNNHACYFCWEGDHSFMDCPEIAKQNKTYILNIRYGHPVKPPPLFANQHMQVSTQEQ